MSTEKLTEISDRIKKLLSSREVSQAAFAKKLGISAAYANNLVSGKKKNISRSLARLISILFYCSEEWLLTGKGKMDVHPSCLVGIQYGGVPAPAENIKIPDMLNKTVDILESDTIFRTALYSNINAFHQALHADQNIKDMKAQMEDLKTSMKLQFAEMGERIRNLEKENAELKNEEQGEREVSAEKPQSSSSRKTE